MVKHVYTSVDIGSDSIKVVVCELYKGKLNLLAATSIRSSGIKKGLITDFEKAAKKLKILLENGIISQEEFETEKAKLVANMEI